MILHLKVKRQNFPLRSQRRENKLNRQKLRYVLVLQVEHLCSGVLQNCIAPPKTLLYWKSCRNPQTALNTLHGRQRSYGGTDRPLLYTTKATHLKLYSSKLSVQNKYFLSTEINMRLLSNRGMNHQHRSKCYTVIHYSRSHW